MPFNADDFQAVEMGEGIEPVVVELDPIDEPPAGDTPVDDNPPNPVDDPPVDDDDPEEPPVDPKTGKRPGGYQRKINRLSEELADTRVFNERILNEVEYLRGRLDGKNPPVEPTPKGPTEEVEPNPDDFTSQAEYLAAVARFETKRQLAEDRKAAARTAAENRANAAVESAVNDLVGKMNKAVETYPELQKLLKQDLPANQVVLALIKDSEQSSEMILHLAKNPAELKSLNDLPPLAAAKKFAGIEAKYVKPATPTPPKTTTAPKPPTPVRSTSVSDQTLKDPGEMSFEEYKDWYNRKYGKKKG